MGVVSYGNVDQPTEPGKLMVRPQKRKFSNSQEQANGQTVPLQRVAKSNSVTRSKFNHSVIGG